MAAPIQRSQSDPILFKTAPPSDPRLEALARAYDQAMEDYNALQLRMETQVQEAETALYGMVDRNRDLTKENAALGKRAEGLVKQIDELGKQLATAKQTTVTLREQLLAEQASGHILRADLEIALKAKQDAERSCDASENRNAAQLAINIKLQAEVDAVRRLPQLREAFRAKKTEVGQINRLRNRQVVTEIFVVPIGFTFAAGFAGFFVAGPFGAFAGVMAAQAKMLSQIKPGRDPRDIEDEKRWNELEAIQYDVIQIQAGISKEVFLAKSAEEQAQILKQCELA